jgi:hypothetical protein
MGSTPRHRLDSMAGSRTALIDGIDGTEGIDGTDGC